MKLSSLEFTHSELETITFHHYDSTAPIHWGRHIAYVQSWAHVFESHYNIWQR